LWKGKRYTPSGYGQFLYSRPDRASQAGIGAHKLAYELEYGYLLPGFFVCHDCPTGDNRLCCNYHHLKPGTPADNIADAVYKGRMMSGDRWQQAHPRDIHITAIRKAAAAHPERFARGERSNLSRLTTEQAQIILALDGRVSPTSLARVFHLTVGGVTAIWTRKTWKHLERITIDPSILETYIHAAMTLAPIRHGGSNGNSKLTDALAKEIFALKDTKSADAIGLIFHISDVSVRNIWRKKTWAHIHEAS
jgi:hypothetical protein